MGRGEEFTKRKQNKSMRKRMRADLGDLNPEETAAAKRRRRKGVRRNMEGMCYTLPTLENPFNEPELRNVHKKTKSQKSPKASGRTRKQATELDDSTSAKGARNGEHNGKLNGDPNGLANGESAEDVREGKGPRRVFWPYGAEGKPPLSGPMDRRLPLAFQTALKAILPEDSLDSLGSQGFRDRVLGGSSQWDVFARQCWEGCLRGQDVLGVMPGGDSGMAGGDSGEAGPSQVSRGKGGEEGPSHGAGDSPGGRTKDRTKGQTEKGPSEGHGRAEANPSSNPRPAAAHAAGLGCALGYLLPAVVHVSAQKPAEAGGGPVALILVASPQRAVAVRAVLKPVRGAMGVRSLSLHQETPLERQMEGLEAQAAEIMVATPGRLWALIKRGALDSLSRVSFLVLECGYDKPEPSDSLHLSQIRALVRPKCHCVLLAPRYPPRRCQLAQEWLADPIARAGGGPSAVASCACVALEIGVCKEDQRLAKVCQFVQGIQQGEAALRVKSRIVVVARAREEVERVRKILDTERHKAVGFFDSHSAEVRAKIADGFRSGKSTTLVMPASALAAPELRLGGVSVLVFADFPASVAEYAAAVGRIARRTTRGQAFCVLTPEMATLAPPLVQFLEACDQPCGPKLAMLAEAVQLVRGSTSKAAS